MLKALVTHLREINYFRLIQVVFCHPEAIISSRTGRKFIRSPQVKEKLVLIAVDEAHMILEW